MAPIVAAADIPKLNFAKFSHGTDKDRQEFGQYLVKSLIDWGFVKVVNHGLSDQAVMDVMEAVRYQEGGENAVCFFFFFS